MANRLTCYLEHDPIVIECPCGEQFALYTWEDVTNYNGGRKAAGTAPGARASRAR